MLTLIECNLIAYDRFSDQLKTSLSQEKQKTSLLNEELKIKKGIVERLRSDLENAKEHLEYLKQEKSKTWFFFEDSHGTFQGPRDSDSLISHCFVAPSAVYSLHIQ